MIPDSTPEAPAGRRDGSESLDGVRHALAEGRPLEGQTLTTLSRLVTDLDPAATEETIAALPAVRGLDVYRSLISWAPIVAGEKVLDIGCGSGGATRAAAEAVGEDGLVVGIDHSPQAIRLAESSTSPDVPVLYRVGRAEHLEGVPDRSFDAAIMSLVLDQIDDIAPALAEAARVLRPGGRLVASVMCWDRLRPVDGPLMGAVLAVVGARAPGALAGRASRATIPDEPADALGFREAGFLTPEQLDIHLGARMPTIDEAWTLFGRSMLGWMLDDAGRAELREAMRPHLPHDLYLPLRLLRTRRPG